MFFLMERFTLSFQSDMVDGQPDNSWISNPILCSVAMLFACGWGGVAVTVFFFFFHLTFCQSFLAYT